MKKLIISLCVILALLCAGGLCVWHFAVNYVFDEALMHFDALLLDPDAALTVPASALDGLNINGDDADPNRAPGEDGEAGEDVALTSDLLSEWSSKISFADKNRILAILMSALTKEQQDRLWEMVRRGLTQKDMAEIMAMLRKALNKAQKAEIKGILMKYM